MIICHESSRKTIFLGYMYMYILILVLHVVAEEAQVKVLVLVFLRSISQLKFSGILTRLAARYTTCSNLYKDTIRCSHTAQITLVPDDSGAQNLAKTTKDPEWNYFIAPHSVYKL